MPTVYEVRDWERHYTVSQNRKNDASKPLPWVAMRTKHDGKGFRRVMRMPNSMELMGAWMLIVEVAAKCPTHGRLEDADGPLTAIDLADKTGGDEAIFERALQVFSSKGIEWLSTTALPEQSESIRTTGRDGMERDGMERDGTGQNGTKSKNPTSGARLDGRRQSGSGVEDLVGPGKIHESDCSRLDGCGSGSLPLDCGTSSPLDGGTSASALLDRNSKSKSHSGPSVHPDSVVTTETLGDLARLRRWFDHDLTRRDTIVKGSDEFWFNTQAAAAKARTASGIQDRVALFKWIVKGERWSYLRCSDDEVAVQLRRETGKQNAFAVKVMLGEMFKMPEGV